ncbi:hypothetical protein [Thioalkalivibrio sulfidiphilus]|uniref:hypothetical protein n=1 Tax=Thioalkalivibrio sulfidiphilus TaxID=1033854 RepID=UPI00036457E7|nr:hypothetical protein [Thioalkalivibrio sulfidiphilus]
MHLTERLNTLLGDQRFMLSALVLSTGLVLTLQNPMARDSAAELISRVQLPDISQVFEMRPQTPPPMVEGDQLANEEIEDVQIPVVSDRDTARNSELFRRPQ